MTQASRYRRYRAPAEDAEVLCDPSWDTLPSLLERNRKKIAECEVLIGGKPFASVRAEARATLIAAASAYTSSYARESGSMNLEGPLVVTGHQPGMHHPGVWLKNFAAGRLAGIVQGTAINLIIDNDLCRESAMQVPSGSVDDPHLVGIPFDAACSQMPFEERAISDQAVWKSFGTVATDSIASIVANPLVEEWWPRVLQLGQDQRLGETLAQARHLLELKWGNQTWEVPFSHLCCAEPFRRFALHLLGDAKAFRKAYNWALADYRQAHGLRNQAQPVPDLSEVDGWIETPFWVWSRKSPRRRPLFVSQEHGILNLSDQAEFQGQLEISSGEPANKSLQQLEAWENEGIKFRTRALATTMYARLFLADLFVHGIGGAKYDQVTDEISERFFGVRPPEHATVTATLRLPIEHPPATVQQIRQLRQELRQLKYHPESLLDRDQMGEADRRTYDQWSKEKLKWIKLEKTPENCAARHQGIEKANLELGELALGPRKEIVKQLAELDHQLRVNRLLESREYPFCLFPQKAIRDFLLDFTQYIP